MPRRRFSIVIPTRQRARTLEFTLRCCLMQSFDDFEIVVCDNCSSPDTREVVESFASPKIKYLRSDLPLAMSDNWELAVSHAQGEFVTVVGDDDALLQHALAEADRLISRFDAKAIRWDWVYYSWPDNPFRPNRLQIPLDCECRMVSSREALHSVAKRRVEYLELPSIYNSFIRYDVIDELRARTGRVFKSMSPDIYSGFAFAHLTEHFLSVLRPMGIIGQSGSSNGQACVNGAGDGSVQEEFFSLNQAAGFEWHDRVPGVEKSITACVADALEHCNANLSLQEKQGVSERITLLDAIIRDLERHANLSADEWEECLSVIAEWSSNDARLTRWYQRRLATAARRRGKTAAVPAPWLKGFARNRSSLGRWKFDVDATDFGITDTVGVAEFFERLFHCELRPITAAQSAAASSKATLKDLLPPAFIRMATSAQGRPRRLGSVIATDAA